MNTNTKPRSLVWQKWFDPLGSNINDFEFPGAIGTMETDEIFEEDDDEYDNTKIQLPGRGLRLVYTPFGVLPITEYNNPDKNFNFWVCHTNFNISKSVKEAIEAVDGVESLTIFSRYRFRIGVGQLFDASQVKSDIQKALNISSDKGLVQNVVLDEDTQKAVNDLKEQISKNNKFWAIYVVPNGEITSVVSNEDNDKFKQEIELYKQAQDGVGGALFLHSDSK
jgi:hypothetical protein